VENIYEREDRVVAEAEALMASSGFVLTPERYGELLGEYRKLLRQTRRMVRISDRMQAELSRLSEELKRMSRIDALTGLYNRRCFNELFQREWNGAVRAGSILSVIMIDVDFFKRYNDHYGHIPGDVCLQDIAGALTEGIRRPRDLLARYGGEEFVVLLPETDQGGAIRVAENLIDKVRGLAIPHAMSPDIRRVSISAGVADARPKEGANSGEVLNAADEALYRAKAAGRDRWSE
jgi:diguanylate cyclase (GGDEF)-like protein